MQANYLNFLAYCYSLLANYVNFFESSNNPEIIQVEAGADSGVVGTHFRWANQTKEPLGSDNTHSQKGLLVGTGKNEVGKATFSFFLQMLLVKKLGQSRCSNLFDMSPA